MSNALADILNPSRHIVRMPINEYDKATVVSILPKYIDERKHTIYPGRFTIEPGSPENPQVLVVGSSSWWKDTGDGQPILEITCPSVIVADSIVKDYCQGYLGSNGDEAGPGLFWIPGPITVDELKVKYKGLLAKANLKQNNWYINLIRLADSLWARANGNPMVIGEDMRMAAKAMGVSERKDWMADFKQQDMENCQACGHMVNPKYPVCPNCKAVVNPEIAAKRGIKFAQV